MQERASSLLWVAIVGLLHHRAMIPSCLVCPLCASAFTVDARTWRCTQGHSFDVAREGYVNLLPVQHKHSRDPGDRAASLAARRAFLEAGHYAPLRSRLAGIAQSLGPHVVLDIGCGEGWYTAALVPHAAEVIGLDIAKPAVRLAARRHAGVTWIVGSGARLPLAASSVDCICTLFTPLHEAEIARVLRPGGQVVVVTPGDDHLQSLRAALFDEVQPHDPDKFRRGFETEFAFEAREDLSFALDLPQAALRELVEMTPYAWKARPERRAAVDAMPGLSTRASFTLLRFRRR